MVKKVYFYNKMSHFVLLLSEFILTSTVNRRGAKYAPAVLLLCIFLDRPEY